MPNKPNNDSLNELHKYILILQRIKNKLDDSGDLNSEEEDIIINGYEKIVRPLVEYFNLKEHKIKEYFDSNDVSYENDADLCAKVQNYDTVSQSIIFLKRLKAKVENYLEKPEDYEKINENDAKHQSDFSLLNLLERFHNISKIITERRKDKKTYEINDEYDVQDLLFLILKSIYPLAEKESTSNALGKGEKKIDIVIPEIETVIEVKFFKENTEELRIVDELKIDIESYHSHLLCKTLIAFIYNPYVRIKDFSKIINDLSGKREKGEHKFDVKVIVNPK